MIVVLIWSSAVRLGPPRILRHLRASRHPSPPLQADAQRATLKDDMPPASVVGRATPNPKNGGRLQPCASG
ncbi:unnamed protein product [Lampetra fluviatilis]